MEAVLPPFTSPQNPVDATGYGLAHQASAARPIVGALEAVTHDPNVDFVLYLGVTIPATPPPDPTPLVQRLDDQAAMISSAPVPVLPASTTCSDVSDYARDLLLPRRLHLLAGLDLGLSAIGHAVRWQAHREHLATRRAARPPRRSPPDWVAAMPPGVWPETDGRRVLEAAGVPVVPAELARSADEAVVVAERIGYPVALKLCGRGLAHKSDIGGVALGLASAAAVRDAHARLLSAAREIEPDGVLVAAMRGGGHELLAGVTVDPTFGPVLAVGMGGVWVEALRDVALRILPIETSDAREMLGELKASALLGGVRGGPAVDLDRVADVVRRVAEAAAMVGPSLQALEVNPLWCRGDSIEALDVLVVTGGREA